VTARAGDEHRADPTRASVAVTGATGFLGASLVRRLVADGVRVRVLTRSLEKAKALPGRGLEIVAGDITDWQAVAAAVDGATVVYHLAGRLLVPGVDGAEYHRTHVEGTRLVLEHCARSGRFERLVHCSTTGVLGVTGDRPADERAPLGPTNVYEATKALAELAVRDATQAGMPAVIVRPGLVYGPGDLHLLGFFRSVLRQQFRPIGRRTVWLHPIFIDDMTEALVRCGRHPTAIGECFHVAGPQPVALSALADAIARAGGTRVPAGHIPLPVARAAAEVGDRLPPRLKHAAPLTRSRLDFLTHSRVYDVTKARRVLGFAAATDLPTGAARTMGWYREHGHLPVNGRRRALVGT
jgi:nucleoside-diphosphate-sugar epimerase